MLSINFKFYIAHNTEYTHDFEYIRYFFDFMQFNFIKINCINKTVYDIIIIRYDAYCRMFP